MECRVVKGENHSLTGRKEEFKAMAGEHFQCYTYCADSLIYSMSELLTAKPMKWTCSFCRSHPDPTDCVMGCGHTTWTP